MWSRSRALRWGWLDGRGHRRADARACGMTRLGARAWPSLPSPCPCAVCGQDAGRGLRVQCCINDCGDQGHALISGWGRRAAGPGSEVCPCSGSSSRPLPACQPEAGGRLPGTLLHAPAARQPTLKSRSALPWCGPVLANPRFCPSYFASPCFIRMPSAPPTLTLFRIGPPPRLCLDPRLSLLCLRTSLLLQSGRSG